ncbi:uncharacterized protein SAPINGB_P006259 [Magnusiomyces paraingens]|uniref:Methyltransferase small domain-containing protein n=1 Tax=Magnusiomyces paraingens TaxID=2606893 RepID=A0A5E8C975_9ASCO|nr:uncharacterized protein SAPINGB_P006259 [Saprochaete ingens]VVT58538.1 unnamed protein product [Saprochaete ingens]
MLHIRFFKPPAWQGKKSPDLNAVLTVANDLGEEPFYGSAELCADVFAGGRKLKSVTLRWTPGMRAVPLKVPGSVFAAVPKKTPVEVRVSVPDPKTAVNLLLDESAQQTLQFLPVSSVPFTSTPEKIAVRKVPTSFKDPLTIYEESQESIARHLWDAGLYTADLFLQHPDSPIVDLLEDSTTKWPPQTVLELGAGCGYVGLAFGAAYPGTRIVLTDLDDAQAICTRNIAANASRIAPSTAEFQVLDWEEEESPLDPVPDLVLVTDCTYNQAYYGALLAMLARAVKTGATVLLAHKHRNDAESSFFESLDAHPGLCLVRRFDMEVAGSPLTVVVCR